MVRWLKSPDSTNPVSIGLIAGALGAIAEILVPRVVRTVVRVVPVRTVLRQTPIVVVAKTTDFYPVNPQLVQFIPTGQIPVCIATTVIRSLSLIHISEPTRLGMISYAVFCLKKK